MNTDQIKEEIRLMDGSTIENTAKSIIRGEKMDLLYMQELAKRLKNESKFNLASELFFRMIDEEPNVPFWRKELAVCLYKDPDLPSDIKYSAALDQLASIPSLNSPGTTRESVIARLDSFDSSEYLGVTAAVFKRKWRYDNLFSNILYAEHFYRKGMEVWENEYPEQKEEEDRKELKGDDAGYCAINYAFVCDLIACLRLEQTDGIPESKISRSSTERMRTAHLVRSEIIRRLTGLDPESAEDTEQETDRLIASSINRKWAPATIAEAFFGLGMYSRAKAFLSLYYREIMADWDISTQGVSNEAELQRRKKVNLHWQLRTTGEQLVWLADLQVREIKKSGSLNELNSEDLVKINGIFNAADECLKILFPDKQGQIDIKTLNSKMGLALSGGGFRASLYHIGVMASLAEHDMLRHVEVLSCVSGGSILGAYYYLLLRRRYNSDNVSLKHEDYIAIIEEMEKTFLEGVQQNIRSRLFSDFRDNMKMLFKKKYTRTHRLGEMYERYLYSKATGSEEPIHINELRINPFAHFNPKTDNWTRRDKIPMLVLNATTLNTGHNWQFTVSWMGEPPGNIRQDVDVKKRLRRMYYYQAPDSYKQFRLGRAVGASSCVPALFAPVSMPGLYPGVDVQLVDGGVHDNQGITSILDQDCKVVIVSDASAQMADSDTFATGQIPVFMRSDLIFQERMREGQLLDLKARENATQIRALGLVHLKKDLHQDPVNWTDSDEPSKRVLRPGKAGQEEDLTNYGIPYEVQDALSKIRTDLDSFHDAEAHALMYSAYVQTNKMLEDAKFDLIRSKKPDSGKFEFKKISQVMEQPHKSAKLAKLLEHSSKVLFKWYHIAPIHRRILTLLVPTGLVLALVYGIYTLSGVLACNDLSNFGSISLGCRHILIALTVLTAPFWASLAIALFWRAYLAGPGSFYLESGKYDDLIEKEEMTGDKKA